MSKKIILKDKEGNELAPLTKVECVEGAVTKEELQADKTNLANFKQHVEADFVKDVDYNNDKGTIMGEIMKKADKTYVSSLYNSSPELLETINAISQKLSDDEDMATILFNEIDKAAIKNFNELWVAAGYVPSENKYFSKYAPDEAPDKDHPYYLNEIWLTLAEALDIYRTSGCFSQTTRSDYAYMFMGQSFRTVFPIRFAQSLSGRCDFDGFMWGSKVEIVNICGYITPEKCYAMFAHCKSLRKILGWLGNIRDSQTFVNCENLEEVLLYNIRNNISFAQSPLLNYKSLNHLVKNRADSNTFTITVHSNIYNAMTGVTTDELNGGTSEQWQQLLLDAVNKNISFATV